MKRRRAALGVGAALVIFLLADAFMPPPAHDVHSPGGVSVKVTLFESNETVAWKPTAPSQSLASLSCYSPGRGTPCDVTTWASSHPSLSQSPHPLFLVWTGCIDWSGGGEIKSWQGFNIEYIPSTRKLVIHCYRAQGWLYVHQYEYGVAAVPRYTLAVVSTADIGGPGMITIIEEDDLEHLVGDQSDQSQLATVTIS